MAGSGYEIFALFMRYVFVALGALILLRAFLWLRKDAGAYRREIRNLPDAGLVGEMVDMQTGSRYPLPREGVLGSGRSCDVRIRGAMVDKKALRFLFVDGKGLAVTPMGAQPVGLDGHGVRGTGYALHGTQMEVGGAVLRIRLFAGLNVPRRVLYDEDGMQLMEDEHEVSPFEEVAGMYANGYEEAPYIPGDMQDNPFMEYMPQDAYPMQGAMESMEMVQEQPYMPQQMDAPQYNAYPPAEQEPWTPPQESQQQTVRHRRGDRYL